jgi:lipase
MEAKAFRRTLRTPAGFAASDEDCDQHLHRGPDGRYRFLFCPSAAICAWSDMARPAPDLGGLDIPLLLVTAKQAPYVTDATRAWLRGDLGDRFSEVVIDAAHMLQWEAFDETVAHLRSFLGSPA